MQCSGTRAQEPLLSDFEQRIMSQNKQKARYSARTHLTWSKFGKEFEDEVRSACVASPSPEINFKRRWTLNAVHAEHPTEHLAC